MTLRVRAINDIRARVGLGRRQATDQRDRAYMLRSVIRPSLAKEITTKTWALSTVLDQGILPQCVAYSWTGFLLAAPLQHRPSTLGSIAKYTQQLYDKSQGLDEWPGEAYDGTSVRGGVKALAELGRAGEYLWAFDAAVARDYVLTRGPLVLGTNWHVEMYKPDADGYIRPIGAVDGGHAYLAVGYNRKREAFRIQNSWGPDWGVKGRVWLKRDDLQKLLDADGECCSAMEIKPAA